MMRIPTDFELELKKGKTEIRRTEYTVGLNNKAEERWPKLIRF